MPILNDGKQDVPVTMTLKAETAMQMVVAMVTMPQIPASEVAKMKDAITSALGI